MPETYRKVKIGPTTRSRDKLSEMYTGQEVLICDKGQPDSLGRVPVRQLGATIYIDPRRIQEIER